MTNDKPMDAAAVVAAAERIVADGPLGSPPAHLSAIPFPFDGYRSYIRGTWWTMRWTEGPIGTFTCYVEPDPSSPA